MNQDRITALLLPAAGFLGGLLLTLLALVILPRTAVSDPQSAGVGDLVLIPAAAVTEGVNLPPESSETQSEMQVLEGKFTPGELVLVTGTNGQGLRLREYPSLGSLMLHLAEEGEEYIVLGGPVSADNYQWWFLEYQADSGRRGWGVEVFLERINN